MSLLLARLAGGTNVTGTMATTLAGATASANGVVEVVGTSSVVLADSTVSATGVIAVTGTCSVVLAGASVAMAGTVTVPGTLSTTLANAVPSFSGVVAVVGTMGASTAGATVAASGVVEVTGTLGATLQNATFTATGVLTTAGPMAVTLEDATVSIAGEVDGGEEPDINGFWTRRGPKLVRRKMPRWMEEQEKAWLERHHRFLHTTKQKPTEEPPADIRPPYTGPRIGLGSSVPTQKASFSTGVPEQKPGIIEVSRKTAPIPPQRVVFSKLTHQEAMARVDRVRAVKESLTAQAEALAVGSIRKVWEDIEAKRIKRQREEIEIAALVQLMMEEEEWMA